MKAVLNGHTETIEVLLENGADVNIKSDDGFSALSTAREWEQVGVYSSEIRQILINAGAKE